jgi:hypothetical protein
MVSSVTGAVAPPTRPTGGSPPEAAPAQLSFRELLSSLNPLQYIPVVGTLYRAITGDRGNEGVHDVGALVLSGAMGGPFGVAASFATALVEKITGFGPEWAGEQVVAELGLKKDAPSPVAAATTVAVAAEAPPAPAAAAVPLTSAQLAAYGVRQGRDGSLAMGTLEGADVLNAIELTRHEAATAVAAYAGRVPAVSSGG